MSKKERKGKHFLKQPIYKGGKVAMDTLIKQSLVYPKKALEEKIEGSVYVRYEIDYKGKVKGTKVLSSLGYGCDEEACRIIKMFQFEVPQIPRKMKALFNKNIRIHFRLPKQKKVTQSIGYQITTQKSTVEQIEKKQKTTYSYTISW